MPANAVTITANYEAIPTDEFLVTVTGGTGSGSYAEATPVTVTATLPTGEKFANWTVEGVVVEDMTQNPLTFVMPANEVTVIANFEPIPEGEFLVTVTGGTGSGSYATGAPVTVTATVPTGEKFVNWTVEGVDVNMTQNPLTFDMPANAVTLTANFEVIPTDEFVVTVTGGIGAGSYAEGETVTVTATVPAGNTFINWTVSGVEIIDKTQMSLTFTMPANPVALVANSTSTVVEPEEEFISHTDNAVNNSNVSSSLKELDKLVNSDDKKLPKNAVSEVVNNETVSMLEFDLYNESAAISKSTFNQLAAMDPSIGFKLNLDGGSTIVRFTGGFKPIESKYVLYYQFDSMNVAKNHEYMVSKLKDDTTYDTVQVGRNTTMPMVMNIQVETTIEKNTPVDIYHYNTKTGKNEHIGESIVDKKGDVHFETRLGGDFLFVEKA